MDRHDVSRAFSLLKVETTMNEVDELFSLSSKHDLEPGEEEGLSFSDFITAIYESNSFKLNQLVLKARMYREMFALFDRDGQGGLPPTHPPTARSHPSIKHLPDSPRRPPHMQAKSAPRSSASPSLRCLGGGRLVMRLKS